MEERRSDVSVLRDQSAGFLWVEETIRPQESPDVGESSLSAEEVSEPGVSSRAGGSSTEDEDAVPEAGEGQADGTAASGVVRDLGLYGGQDSDAAKGARSTGGAALVVSFEAERTSKGAMARTS